ncbi:hypothetical protein C1646_752572 [Rhizophagus diaphanus]|nr:hypothetical protein C1646_752572 [Rhizophagus diaphanus] [Rhizophagus sp. MUCL 43196]
MSPFKPIVSSRNTATLIDNKLYILCGYDDSGTIPVGRNLTNIENLALVYMFDIQSNSWSKIVEVMLVGREVYQLLSITIEKCSSPMVNYGATLLPNKNIIYIGGMIGSEKKNESLALNDYKKNFWAITFEWSIPNVSGGISKRMGYNKLIESYILLLDINNNNEYKWTIIFDPSTPPSPSSPFSPSLRPSSTNPKTLSRITPAAMAGAIIGSLFGVILLSFGSYFLYKWNKNNQNQKHITRTVLIPHSYSNC